MTKFGTLVFLVAGLSALCVTPSYSATRDDMQAQLESLRRENAAMRKEIAALRGKQELPVHVAPQNASVPPTVVPNAVPSVAGESNPASVGVNWTGFYIGGNMGRAHSTYLASNRTGGAANVLTIPGFGDLPIGSATTGLSGGGLGDNSVEGGGQIGLNYQIGQAVLGLEADIQSTNLNANFNDSADLTAVGNFNLNSQISTNTDWFATVRGRVGYSSGTLMPYITGGLAVSHVETTISNSISILGFPTALPTISDSFSRTPFGYAVGGGLEYAAGYGWSVKGEYLHLGFGNESYDLNTPYSVPGSSVGFSGATVNGNTAAHADLKMSFDLARLGVNYRF